MTKNSKTPIVNLFKNHSPFQNYIFKMQLEINFLTFWNTDQTLQFFLEQFLYRTLLEKCFENWFSTTGSARTRKHANFHFPAFSSWGTSYGRKSVIKNFSNKVLYNYCSKKNQIVFFSIWKSQKIYFPLYLKM